MSLTLRGVVVTLPPVIKQLRESLVVSWALRNRGNRGEKVLRDLNTPVVCLFVCLRMYLQYRISVVCVIVRICVITAMTLT